MGTLPWSRVLMCIGIIPEMVLIKVFCNKSNSRDYRVSVGFFLPHICFYQWLNWLWQLLLWLQAFPFRTEDWHMWWGCLSVEGWWVGNRTGQFLSKWWCVCRTDSFDVSPCGVECCHGGWKPDIFGIWLKAKQLKGMQKNKRKKKRGILHGLLSCS